MTTFFGTRWLISASMVAALSLALISQAKAQDNCNNGRGPFGRGNPNGQTNFYGSTGNHHFGGGYRDHDRGHHTNFRGNDWDRDHDRFGRGSYNRFDYANHNGYHDRYHNAAFRTPAYPGFAPPYGVSAPYTGYDAGAYGVSPYAAPSYAAPTYTTPVVVPTTPVPTTTIPGYGRGLNLTTPNGFGFGLNF
jgi:hypothetical protein